MAALGHAVGEAPKTTRMLVGGRQCRLIPELDLSIGKRSDEVGNGHGEALLLNIFREFGKV